MTVRVGINGLGPIGRSFVRAALSSTAEIEVVAINDVTDAKTVACLLEWDSIAGHLDGVHTDGQSIIVRGVTISGFAQREPARIPWGEHRLTLTLRQGCRLRP